MARDEDLTPSKAIRLCAYRAVTKLEPEYLLRKVFRWYSREFHTPLAEVETLPVEDILEHYFECMYENLDDEETEHKREEIEARLIETHAERLAREAKEAEEAKEDDAFLKQVQEEAKAAKKPQSLDEKLDQSNVPSIPVSIMGQTMPTTFQEISAKLDPKLKQIPEGITMKFEPPGAFDDLDEFDLMDDRKTKKP